MLRPLLRTDKNNVKIVLFAVRHFSVWTCLIGWKNEATEYLLTVGRQ